MVTRFTTEMPRVCPEDDCPGVITRMIPGRAYRIGLVPFGRFLLLSWLFCQAPVVFMVRSSVNHCRRRHVGVCSG